MERVYRFNKETKNTICFSELETEDGFMTNTIYVQKNALEEMGWEYGNDIRVEVNVLPHSTVN